MKDQQTTRWITASFLLITALFIFTNTSQAQSWENIGPGGGGWITAMTVVNDAQHTVYVGCDVGGIYKSTDHGQTWTIKDEGLSIYFMHDIEYDRTNPEILYLASRGGVFKSIDGGDHWEAKRNGMPPIEDFSFSTPMSDIAIDPFDHNTIFAAVGVPNSGYDLDSYHWQSSGVKGTIYKSTDAADTWTAIYNTGIPIEAMIYSLAIDPTNSNIMYAATSEGVYKSTDAGANWTLKNTNIPHGLTMRILINPSNTDILYVTIWALPGSPIWQGGIYKSTNGGNTWAAINNGLPQVMGSTSGFTTNYPNLLMDEQNPETLYIGNIPYTPDPGVYKTTDGGANWTWVSRAEPPNQNISLGWISEDQASAAPMAMAIDQQDPNRLYFGTSMHLFTTDNAGDTWTYAYTNDMGNGYWQGNGFETTVCQAITVDPSNPDNVYFGYWDIGFLKSTDGGSTFKRSVTGMTYPNNVFDIIVDPANPAILYAAGGWWEDNYGEVYKSTNYGESWTPLNNGIVDAQIWSIALDENSPVNSRTLYATSYENGIFKTTDGGQSWFSVSNGLGTNGNLQMRKITIDPNNSNILYAGLENKTIEIGDNLSTVQGGVYKSVDAGVNWTRIDNSAPQLSVWDIEVDPNNSSIVYTAVDAEYDHTLQEDFLGGVYKSTDGGSTWQLLNNGFGNPENLIVTAIDIDPTDSNILYATTSDSPFHDDSSGRGIFKSTDGGNSWQAMNNGLGVLYYDAITIDPNNPSTLFAGSGGNGAYKWTGAVTEVALKVLLQGPYDQGTNLMNDQLRQNNVIPLTEPFTSLGIPQVMSGGETIDSSVMTITGNDAIADWVLVEMRDANNASLLLATQPALLQRDGDVVDLDGVSPVRFNTVLPDVFVGVRHRNHHGIRSLNSFASNQAIALDFTSPSTAVFGINPMENVGGVMVLIAGDANKDGQINAVDKNNYWRVENGNPYDYFDSKADFNMDGVVNPVDLNGYWRLNNSKVEQLD